MGIADLTRFCNICFVYLVIEICCFLICKSSGSCSLNYYKENGKCIECPRGSVGYNCSQTCPSGFFGKKCNEKCNCSSNQRCDTVIGCLEKNVKITTERLSMQNLTETPNFTGCPKEHICNTTCPSGFDGDICNKMCNCTENQDCSSTIVCLKQNDSISISKTPLQYDPESIRVTVSTNFSKNRDDTTTTKDLSRLKIILFVFIGSFCVGVTVAFLMILKSRLEIAGIYPVRCKIADRQRECSFEQDNIEADDDGLVLNGHSNTRRETVDSSNNVYYELSSSGLNDDNTDSLTENISAEESVNEYQHVSITGHYDVLSLRTNIDPINTNILRLYPECPRDEYHAVNVCYLEEVNKSEDFETNPGSPNSINEA